MLQHKAAAKPASSAVRTENILKNKTGAFMAGTLHNPVGAEADKTAATVLFGGRQAGVVVLRFPDYTRTVD